VTPAQPARRVRLDPQARLDPRVPLVPLVPLELSQTPRS
jgi:hypothetical protein